MLKQALEEILIDQAENGELGEAIQEALERQLKDCRISAMSFGTAGLLTSDSGVVIKASGPAREGKGRRRFEVQITIQAYRDGVEEEEEAEEPQEGGSR